MIKLFVGYDHREAVAYHVFSHSVQTKSSEPVSITPLMLTQLRDYSEGHTDGSNQFIYSRFLVPYLCQYTGWAIFADGDMVCMDDIAKLWAMRNPWYAVQVAKHDYKTKAPSKYLGAKNEDYPRKNWSSLILWNCSHWMNRSLNPQYVSMATGAHLHRFQWLPDDRIGAIPLEWNWLADEYETKPDVSLVHYTLGTPCFNEYSSCAYADKWHEAKQDMLNVQQVA